MAGTTMTSAGKAFVSWSQVDGVLPYCRELECLSLGLPISNDIDIMMLVVITLPVISLHTFKCNKDPVCHPSITSRVVPPKLDPLQPLQQAAQILLAKTKQTVIERD